MALIHIVSAKEFIKRLSLGLLNEAQTIRATAYLRAKGHVFYDNWSKEHCIIHDNLMFIKSDVLKALKIAFGTN